MRRIYSYLINERHIRVCWMYVCVWCSSVFSFYEFFLRLTSKPRWDRPHHCNLLSAVKVLLLKLVYCFVVGWVGRRIHLSLFVSLVFANSFSTTTPFVRSLSPKIRHTKKLSENENISFEQRLACLFPPLERANLKFYA